MAMRATPTNTFFPAFSFVLQLVALARAHEKQNVANLSEGVLLLTDAQNAEWVIHGQVKKKDGTSIGNMAPLMPVAGVPQSSIVTAIGTTTTDHAEMENASLAIGEAYTASGGRSTNKVFEAPEHTKEMHGVDVYQEEKLNFTDELLLNADEPSAALSATLAVSASTETVPPAVVSTTTSTQPGVPTTVSLKTTSVHSPEQVAATVTSSSIPPSEALPAAVFVSATTSAQSPAVVSSVNTSARPARSVVLPVTGMDFKIHGSNFSSAGVANDSAAKVVVVFNSTSSVNTTHAVANRSDADGATDIHRASELLINDFSQEDGHQFLHGVDKEQQPGREQHKHDQPAINKIARFWTPLGSLALLFAFTCLCVIIYKLRTGGLDSNFQKMVDSRTPKRFGCQGDESPVYQFSMV